MSIGTVILHHRKKNSMTQEVLAQKLGVTNQAVSKWESDQACPDIQLLPALADLFKISIDALFGRTPAPEARSEEPLPWKNDDTLYVAVYQGHRLLSGVPGQEQVTFCYEGPALNIHSTLSVSCGDVGGNVTAEDFVSCGNVTGSVEAGSYVSGGNVSGGANAGTHISCGNVVGTVNAGTSVGCGNVTGNVFAGDDVKCGDVGGHITAGGNITQRSAERVTRTIRITRQQP